MGAMRSRLLTILLSAAFVAPLAWPGIAAADPPGYRKHGRRGHHHHYHHRHHPPAYGYVAPGVYIGLPQVVIAPPPIVITPGPIVAQAPPRVRCRAWEGSVVIGGQVQPAYGTQCLMPDGTWRLVD